MATGAFTTWTALAAAMRDDLASGNFRTVSSYTMGGAVSQTLAYRTVEEFLKLLAYVERQAAAEADPDFDGQIVTVMTGRC
jgi:hypothetical protein